MSETCDRYPDCDPGQCPNCKSERVSYADDVDRDRWSCFDCGHEWDGCTDCQAARRMAGRLAQ